MIFREITTFLTHFARWCITAEFLAVEASGHVNICFLDVFGRSEDWLTKRPFANAVSNIVLSCKSTLTVVILALSGFLMKRLIVTFLMCVELL